MRRFRVLLAAGVAWGLSSPVATAQQTTAAPAPSAQAPGIVAPSQVVWTPTYCRDAAGALWLVYVPSAAAAIQQPPADASAPVQRIAPAQPASAPVQTLAPVSAAPAPTAAGPGSQVSPSLVRPSNPEQGTGRNVRMHKPWMKGRR